VSTTGVVLLHGKWDSPPFAIASLVPALNDAGHATRTSTFPWSLRHLYDRPLDAAYDLIRADAHRLREAGCQKIVLCGHSLGGAVALAYAAHDGDANGVITLAPGHFPERMAATGHTIESLATASAHRGDARRRPLTDVFQGAARRLRIRPDHYLDYFDPAGALVWPDNVRALGAHRPLLWIVGDKDPAKALGINYAFTHKNAHPLDRYVCLPTDHVGTPNAATAVVLEWLSRLDPMA